MFHGRMIDPVTIARTALDAQSTNVSVIADNIANANTPDYAPKHVAFIPLSPGVGVGAIIASPQASVDVGSELTNLIVAKYAYEAATKVISASNQMMHDLLAAI